MRVEVDVESRSELDERAAENMQKLTHCVIGAAITVHKALGPGFVEGLYENALCIELDRVGLSFERQLGVSIFFREVELGSHRLDLLVEGELIVELKAVEHIETVHFATVRSYLHAFGLAHALILNFRRSTLEIKRVESRKRIEAVSAFSRVPRFPRSQGCDD